MSFDSATLGGIAGNGNDVKMSLGDIDNNALSDRQRQAIGDRPGFSARVLAGDNYIHQFDGNVTVEVPYMPMNGEDPSKLRAYYIDDNGKKTLMDSRFDIERNVMVMMTDHFSVFIIDQAESDEGGNNLIYIAAAVGAIAVIGVAAVMFFRRS